MEHSKRRDAAKSMFLVAYSSKSKTINQEMMRECGLSPMECHSLEYQGFKYSYVKLYKRVRAGQIRAFMLHAINKFGVEQDDDVQSLVTAEKKSNALVVHPVLRLIRAKISNPASDYEMESWKDEGGSAKMMGKRFKVVEPGEVANAAKELQRVNAELDNLAEENDDLIDKNVALKEDIKKLESKNHTLETKCAELRKRLQDSRALPP